MRHEDRLALVQLTRQPSDGVAVALHEHVEVGEIAGDALGQALAEIRSSSASNVLGRAVAEPVEVDAIDDQPRRVACNRKMLPAHMTLTANRRLVLTVDDRGADYPVTVDPFAHGLTQTFTVNNILHSGVADGSGSTHTLFGFSVSDAGDVNGDHLGDIIIGAPTFAVITSINASAGGTIALNTGVGVAVTGAAFIYYGVALSAPSTTPSKVLQPSGLAPGALFGFSVAGIGNAGGSATHTGVIVGAPGDQLSLTFGVNTVTVAIGRAYVYTSSGNFSGSIAAATIPDAVLSMKASDFTAGGPNRNPLFGFSVADAGDVDGDSFDDIVIGSPEYNDGTANGRIDIYRGGASGVSSTSAKFITGSRSGENFGFSVSGAGKVNNDAFADVIVGAPGSILSGGVVIGHAYIFHGGNTASAGLNVNTDNDLISNPAKGTILTDPPGLTGTLFGFSVSAAGDVDNDLHGDVIVGAPLGGRNATSTFPPAIGANGAAYVFYGSGNASGAGNPSRAMATLTSPRAAAGLNLLFGFSVGRAGNSTGDVSGDVLVGEPGSLAFTNTITATLLLAVGSGGISGANNVTGGRAYLFTGNSGSAVSATPITIISDPTTPINVLGASVHYAGDVDGDGVADFLVGEPSGIFDLGFNITSLNPSAGTGLLGTLSVGANAGLLPSSNAGNFILVFGIPGTTLPLSLLTFTGQAEKGDVLLNWTTAQEENSDFFQVERSTDNMNFGAIGKVEAAHNSTHTTSYSFVDESPVAGNNYYRLKIVDIDGKFVYSKIVVINFSSGSGSGISIYPNPAHGSFRVLFRNMLPGRYEMNLLNAIGQTIQSKVIQVADPVNYNTFVELDPGLAQGTYLVRIVDQRQRSYITKVVVR